MSREINTELIDKLSHLCRLEFVGDQREKIKSDLDTILSFCDKLNEVDTEGVEPLIYLTDRINPLREDRIEAPMAHDLALKNAPEKDSDYFKVPKVISKS
jgi:aspartyl-tRNA(Asn)/glutamyl-tRNA(Gln) amidotransferase subunit C